MLIDQLTLVRWHNTHYIGREGHNNTFQPNNQLIHSPCAEAVEDEHIGSQVENAEMRKRFFDKSRGLNPRPPYKSTNGEGKMPLTSGWIEGLEDVAISLSLINLGLTPECVVRSSE